MDEQQQNDLVLASSGLALLLVSRSVPGESSNWLRFAGFGLLGFGLTGILRAKFGKKKLDGLVPAGPVPDPSGLIERGIQAVTGTPDQAKVDEVQRSPGTTPPSQAPANQAGIVGRFLSPRFGSTVRRRGFLSDEYAFTAEFENTTGADAQLELAVFTVEKDVFVGDPTTFPLGQLFLPAHSKARVDGTLLRTTRFAVSGGDLTTQAFLRANGRLLDQVTFELD